MERRSLAPIGVPATLYFLTAITLTISLARSVQVPMGTLPDDALRFRATPLALWLHAVAGVLFGLLGPMQFSMALRRCFGSLHRLSGRVFVLAGALLGLSGLRLVAFFGGQIDPTDMARAAFGALLIVCLWQGIDRARARDMQGHRDWMIRAYAVGMGSAPLAFIYIPIFLILGAVPATGPRDHAIFVGVWLSSIAAGEIIIARMHRRSYKAA